MRGRPNNPVPCEVCGAPGYPKNRRCLKHWPPTARVKYPFDERKDDIIRQAWLNAHDRDKLHAAITDATRRIGYPRYIVKLRAQRIGVTFDTRHLWEPWEEQYLEKNAGSMTVKAMAKALGHGYTKIQAKIGSMGLRYGIREGMTVQDISASFGVSHHTVQQWERSGALVRRAGRFREEAVRTFAAEHPELYDLRRVDQDWYKALLFPRAKCFMPLERAKPQRDEMATQLEAAG